jgi:hypothetical protein
MNRFVCACVLFASSVPLSAQPTPASLKSSPAAMNLFERDWVLMNWALKMYDSNHDILLDPDEAAAAAEDGDGRVTPEEYRAAREAILSRG